MDALVKGSAPLSAAEDTGQISAQKVPEGGIKCRLV